MKRIPFTHRLGKRLVIEGRAVRSRMALRRPFSSDTHAERPIRFPMDGASFTRLHDLAWKEFPDWSRRTVSAAEAVLEGRVFLLGQAPTEVGNPPRWHEDAIHGHMFPMDRVSHRIRPAPYPGGYDIKVPWQLNRCHHWVLLLQAHVLTSDPRFRSAFVAQLQDWKQNNPPGRGVNWSCAMEVAIRLCNLLFTYHGFEVLDPFDPDTHETLVRMVWEHTTFLRIHLEDSPPPGNHYLADLTGMSLAGMLHPALRESAGWRAFAQGALADTLAVQVLPDGIHYEGSMAYHALVMECLLVGYAVARQTGTQVPPPIPAILQSMTRALHAASRPDGSRIIWGDDDGGRLLPLDGAGIIPHHAGGLLSLAAVLFDQGAWACTQRETWIPALWLCGPEVFDTLTHSHPSSSDTGFHHFENSGLILYGRPDSHLAVSVGSTGLREPLNHSHADTGSVEYWSHGVPWLMDPGTGTYSSNWPLRALFRTPFSHNTAFLPGRQTPSAPLFGSVPRPRSALHYKVADASGFALDFSYRQNEPGFTHRRAVLFLVEPECLIFLDQLTVDTSSPCHLAFHFGPGLNLTPVPFASGSPAWVLQDPRSPGALGIVPSCLLAGFRSATGSALTAPCYGTVTAAPLLVLSTPGASSAGVATAFVWQKEPSPTFLERFIQAVDLPSMPEVWISQGARAARQRLMTNVTGLHR